MGHYIVNCLIEGHLSGLIDVPVHHPAEEITNEAPLLRLRYPISNPDEQGAPDEDQPLPKVLQDVPGHIIRLFYEFPHHPKTQKWKFKFLLFKKFIFSFAAETKVFFLFERNF